MNIKEINNQNDPRWWQVMTMGLILVVITIFVPLVADVVRLKASLLVTRRYFKATLFTCAAMGSIAVTTFSWIPEYQGIDLPLTVFVWTTMFLVAVVSIWKTTVAFRSKGRYWRAKAICNVALVMYAILSSILVGCAESNEFIVLITLTIGL